MLRQVLKVAELGFGIKLIPYCQQSLDAVQTQLLHLHQRQLERDRALLKAIAITIAAILQRKLRRKEYSILHLEILTDLTETKMELLANLCHKPQQYLSKNFVTKL